MITIIQNVSSLKGLNIDKLEENFQEALQQLKIPDSEVTIVFESNKKLKELKYLYLGINETTDVLSFKSDEINPETEKQYLGDIVISLEKAIDQAKDKNKPIELEVLTLVVHGLLHLLNYDHANEPDAENMYEKQNSIIEIIDN